ncbi:hypothetical protein I7I48_03755 [Histoplasma ohiense]|nr:hypothetical protein I7I48_03755 [Histoplasma ohiense (nom. inval.)]
MKMGALESRVKALLRVVLCQQYTPLRGYGTRGRSGGNQSVSKRPPVAEATEGAMEPTSQPR